MQHKLESNPNLINNLRGFWGNFFAYGGVYVVWPLSILSITLVKTIKYLKYLIVTVFFATVVYAFKAYLPYYYFVSIFALFCIMASEWIALRKYRVFVLSGVFLLNLFSLLPLIQGIHNPLIFTGQQNDNIRKVGILSKKCIVEDNETYISTEDNRTSYYFGRPSTVYQDGMENRIAQLRSFSEGQLQNVKLIHFVRRIIPTDLELELRQKSQITVEFQNDVVLIYKDCTL